MADLKINNVYLIHSGYYPIFNKEYFEALIPMVHTHTTNRMDDGERFYFECPLVGRIESVDKWSLKSSVFEDEDAFLIFSAYESKRINNNMDDYFKNLVDKSKEKYPEKWI